jgi:chemotaxis protein MotB
LFDNQIGELSYLKQKEHNKHGSTHNTGADRYLITYADLITLLLGLFVILYATSQVDAERFKEYSAAFSEYFKSKDDKVLQGGDGVLEGHRKGIPEPILPPAPQRNLSEIGEIAKETLAPFIEKKQLTIDSTADGLKISLSENLLFKSAKSEVEKEGRSVVDSISGVLRGINLKIFIDGHTDSDKIRTFQYESNWHLSVTRATNVAYLLIKNGVPEHNLVIRGYGAQRPIADNITDEGKAKNRRVDIFIQELSPESPTVSGYEK